MSKIRVFIGIALESDLNHKVNEISKSIQKKLYAYPIKWVDQSNFHLTVKFLGEIEENRLAMIKSQLSNISLIEEYPIVEITGFGAFPSTTNPNILWLGINKDYQLLSIHEKIENIFSNHGFQKEKRNFSPHLTIGRIWRNSSLQKKKISKIVQSISIGTVGRQKVQKIHLYQSLDSTSKCNRNNLRIP